MTDVKRDTQSRAQRLQHLCSSLSLRSMVFILGIDSRKNRTTEKLFHWLFTGVSGGARLSALSLSLDYEEVAWVVTPSQVHVFLGCACGGKRDTAAMHEVLLEACATWPDVVVEHLAEWEFEDSEAAENTKMLWFTRLMKQLDGPTGLCGGEVETWPLIQAYALDLFGLGFFTMKHPAVDITAHIESLFHEFDPCLLQAIKQEQIPRLTNSLSQTREAVNKRNYVMGRGELSAATLAEFLAIPYEYALLQSEKECRLKPEVRFFPHAEGKLHSATHATIRAVCGQTNLLCARSWFFLPHKSLRDLLAKRLELLPLHDLYQALAQSLRSELPLFTSEAQGLELLQHRLLQHHVFKANSSFLDSARYHLSLILRSIDADGSEQPFNPSHFPLHTAQVVLADIRSEAGDDLGALELAESFSTGEFELLTESVPLLCVWDKREEGGWAVDYGQRLAAYENFTLLTESLELLGALWVYKTALVFVAQACGRIDVTFSDLQELVVSPGNLLRIKEEECTITIKVNTSCLNLLETTLGRSIPREEVIPSSPSEVLPSAESTEPRPSSQALVVVTGVPGSGKTTLADQLCKHFTVPCVRPQTQEQAYFNAHYYEQAIAATQAPVVVVVLPGYTAAQSLEGNVVCVIVKLHSEFLMRPDHRALQPLLRELIREAHVCIVEEQTEVSAALKRQMKRMNPALTLFYVKTMLPPSMLRAVWEVRRPPRLTVVRPPLLPLQSAYLQVPIPLNRQKLEENLRTLQEKESADFELRVAAESHMNLWHLKGTLLLSSPKGLAAFEVSGPPAALSFRPSTEDHLGLFVVGSALEPSRICAVLLSSRSLADKVPLRTRESLAAEELELLSQGLETPEGYFFDGYYYVNAEGEKTKRHPLLDGRIAVYLEEENERIGDFNRKVQKEGASLQRSNAELRVYSLFS